MFSDITLFSRGLILACAVLSFAPVLACQCPPTTLSREETEKYEVIFRGTVDSVKSCGDRPGEAYFTVSELYKGNAEKNFTVQFDCSSDCAVGFREGEEWIIYSRYRQVNVALMDWCSRSRRYFKHEREDFYQVNYGNDYFTEVKYLREELGLHRLVSKKEHASGARNRLPGTTLSLVLIVCSLAGVVIFYILFRRFFR